MRLDKWLSMATNDSRSQLKQWIRSGQVTVNQKIVTRPETAVQETDVVALRGTTLADPTSPYCLLLYKPTGYVSAVTDAKEHTVMECIPSEYLRKNLAPVGRLDKDTSGMLLLTNDGAFAHTLLSPKKHIPKYYHMLLARPFEESYIRQFAEGISLSDGTTCQPAELRPVSETEREAVLCLHEGKYHQVRRMMAAVGNHVEQLRRVAIGNLCLPAAWTSGTCQRLTSTQIDCLQQEPNPNLLWELSENSIKW